MTPYCEACGEHHWPREGCAPTPGADLPDVALRMPRGRTERRRAQLRALLAPHETTMRRLAEEG